MVATMRLPAAVTAAVLGIFWSGCSTDVSGLGPELDADATVDETSSIEGDTAVDEDAEVDSSIVDTAVDTAVIGDDSATGADDGAGGEVSIEAGADADATGADGGSDAADGASDTTIVEAGLDASVTEASVTDASVTDASGDEASADTLVTETAVDAWVDAGPLASTPGSILCSSGGCSKKYCCGNYNVLGLRWDFACSDTCGLTGAVPYDYACDDKTDCGTGQVCCVALDLGGGWSGSGCKASCGTAPQLCATHAECGSGKTCTLQKVRDASFSYGVCK